MKEYSDVFSSIFSHSFDLQFVYNIENIYMYVYELLKITV